MATRKASGPYGQFIARLKALGCVFCPACYAYMMPHHVAHLGGVQDHHESTLAVARSGVDGRMIAVETKAA